jgi:hypothetical protein
MSCHVISHHVPRSTKSMLSVLRARVMTFKPFREVLNSEMPSGGHTHAEQEIK